MIAACVKEKRMSTRQKVDAVLEVMRELGEIQDAGYCGPRGRQLSVHTVEPVQMAAVFYQDPGTWTYRLEFSMRFSSAQPHQITEAASYLAAQQAKIWAFLPEERQAVFDLLEEHFGVPSK